MLPVFQYYKYVTRKILAITFLLMLLCGNSLAADLDIGTHASFFIPPEGGGNTLMTGIDANYRLNTYFSARGSIDNANYQTNEHQYSLTSLTVTLIGHLLGESSIDPYVGAGVGYYDKKIDGNSDSSTGLNALAGISAKFTTFSVGLEVKYIIPDTKHMETGFYSVGGQLTGGLHISM